MEGQSFGSEPENNHDGGGGGGRAFVELQKLSVLNMAVYKVVKCFTG